MAFVAVERRVASAQESASLEGVSAIAAAEDGEPSSAEEAAAEAAAAAQLTPTSYLVQPGDTLFSVARKHGVSVDAVLWANDLTDADVIKSGQELVIPSSTGKLHVVMEGDTVEALADSYGVPTGAIVAVNGLADDDSLSAGQRLLIPMPLKPPSGDPAFTPAPLVAASAEEPVPIPENPGTGSPTPPLFSSIAPMVQSPGAISSNRGSTVTVTNRKIPKLDWPVSVNPPKTGVSQGFRPGHTGIDIYTPQGTPIRAAAAGTVKMAEKYPNGFSGYGWIVILDHDDGIATWYAHCGSFAVKTGDKVKAGEKIGTVGMTGRTTGPHLHFELRVNASAVDPRLALA